MCEPAGANLIRREMARIQERVRGVVAGERRCPVRPTNAVVSGAGIAEVLVMSARGSGRDDAGDLDRRVILPVAVAATHILAAAEFLDDDFLVAELANHLGDDPGTGQERG